MKFKVGQTVSRDGWGLAVVDGPHEAYNDAMYVVWKTGSFKGRRIAYYDCSFKLYVESPFMQSVRDYINSELGI